MRVRIGVVNAKELELDVGDADEVVAAYEKAAKVGEKLFWVTQESGVRLGIVASKVGYIEIEPDKSTKVGFSAVG